MSVVAAAPPRTWAQVLRLYMDMTRPRVLLLVIFTGLPALAMAAGGWPDLRTAAWVLGATALAGGSCSVLNAYMERDIDARMARTSRRPLPVAALAPGHALGYGVGLAVVSTGLLYLTGGWLAAAVGLGTILFYVLVYTGLLKRRTPQNIVIGGAAGSTAPMIAEAALTGELTFASWILFLIIFLWTPPHFWAIAIFRKGEYQAAGLPMMPNVVGDQQTRWQSLLYTLALVPVTLAPVLTHHLGWLYAVTALALGLWFTAWNVRVLVEQRPDLDYRMFKASVVYLFLLFSAMLLDLGLVTARA